MTLTAVAAVAVEELLTYEGSQALIQRDDALDAALRRVGELDFTLLRIKLCEEQGWTAEICREIEGLYRQFLALNVRYPEVKLCPSGPVDAWWHAHILDTQAYAADCQRLFGGFLHHYPYFGMRGTEDRAALEAAFSRTIDLFIRHFGIDPTAGDGMARSCRPQRCP